MIFILFSYLFHIYIIFISYLFHIFVIFLTYLFHIYFIFISYYFHIIFIFISYCFHIYFILFSYFWAEIQFQGPQYQWFFNDWHISGSDQSADPLGSSGVWYHLCCFCPSCCPPQDPRNCVFARGGPGAGRAAGSPESFHNRRRKRVRKIIENGVPRRPQGPGPKGPVLRSRKPHFFKRRFFSRMGLSWEISTQRPVHPAWNSGAHLFGKIALFQKNAKTAAVDLFGLKIGQIDSKWQGERV